jgi:adenylyltransferase/sulfurtransferase
MGSLQALQAVKVVLNLGEQLIGKLLIIDAMDLTFRSIKIGKDDACPVCNKE